MSFPETIAKSVELDQALAKPLRGGTMPEEIGGKRLVGELAGMFQQIRATVAEAKLGIAAAGSELMTEVQGLKVVEKAIRAETASVREFKTKMLGNAVAGENEDLGGEKG